MRRWLVLGLLASIGLKAAETNSLLIDLPTTLKLAGTQNLDVRIAREKQAEAHADAEAAAWQYFPSINIGAGYRRHDNRLQDVVGNILDVEKQSYAFGPTISGQLDLGEVIYRNLVARQVNRAAIEAAEHQKQISQLAAAAQYVELVRSEAGLRIGEETWRISTNYSGQLERAFAGGLAFKGDLLRASVQAQRNLAELDKAREQNRTAQLRLAEILHLASGVELHPRDLIPMPFTLVSTNSALDHLVAQALAENPRAKEARHLEEAAANGSKAATYAPLVPGIGASIFAGGFGGGKTQLSGPAESEDYQVTLGWRIGPGGLFDKPRKEAAQARLARAALSRERVTENLQREVRENFFRLQSLYSQAGLLQSAVQTAEQTAELMRQRKEFAVGAVLETIQSEQDLARSQLDLLNVISEYNRAQLALLAALGQISN